jgi:phage tail-like protein
MATGSRVDPYRGFNFLVEIDGITQAGFMEVTGLDASTPAVDYRQGDFGTRGVSKLPGINTYSAISLKRGLTDSKELWDWRQTVIDGHVERKNGSIVLLDEKGTEKIRWNFANAWPSKWTGPTFNATATGVAVEQLELTHEEVKRA